MFGHWAKSIAKNKEVRGEDFRVLLYLLSELDGYTVNISQSKIAEDLDIKYQNVNRAINRLCKLKIIRKIYEAGQLVGYRILESE